MSINQATIEIVPAAQAVVELSGSSTPTVVEVSVAGPQGPPGQAGQQGAQGTPASYSNATPQPLGAATPGTVEAAARADHRHAMPTAGDVGADPAGTAAAAVATHLAAADPHPQYLTQGEGDGRYAQLTDSRLSDAREWSAPTAVSYTHLTLPTKA